MWIWYPSFSNFANLHGLVLKIYRHFCLFMINSVLSSCPGPKKEKQPHNIMLLSLCFIAGSVLAMSNAVFDFCQIYFWAQVQKFLFWFHLTGVLWPTCKGSLPGSFLHVVWQYLFELQCAFSLGKAFFEIHTNTAWYRLFSCDACNNEHLWTQAPKFSALFFSGLQNHNGVYPCLASDLGLYSSTRFSRSARSFHVSSVFR